MESKVQLAPDHIVSWWQNQDKAPALLTIESTNRRPTVAWTIHHQSSLKLNIPLFFSHLCFLRGKWPFTIFSVFREVFARYSVFKNLVLKSHRNERKNKNKNIFHSSWAEIGYPTNLKSEQFFLVYKYVSSFGYQVSHSLTVKSIHKQGLCTQGLHSPHILWGYPVSVTRLSPQDEDTSTSAASCWEARGPAMNRMEWGRKGPDS